MEEQEEYKPRNQTIFLRPSEIHFSQEYIENRFEDGELIGKRLDDLYFCLKKIDDIRKMRVVNVHGRWFTLDNRRLWVFRNYEKLQLQCYRSVTIPVLVWEDFESDNQTLFSARNEGAEVQILKNQLPGGEMYKRVDSINTKTYDRPMIRFAKDVTKASFFVAKTVSLFVWNGITIIYQKMRH